MTMMDESRKEQLTALCGKMIKAQSYSGHENLVAEEMKTFWEANGFRDIHVDRYGNCICHIKGSRPGPRILFDGHMDTVPVADASKWEHDPFGAEIVDGRMYGRGTSDMKGALSAMLAAAVFFAKDCGNDFAGDIYVAGVVHEECFEGVAALAISEYVQPDVVVIGEASLCNVKIGQRGRAEIVVETFGVPAHSANPEKGVNAVYGMCRVIEEIRKLTPPSHPVMGKGILELTDIKSSPYPGASVVPEYCRATYDRRLLVGETKESVLKPIQDLLDRMMAEDPALKAKVSFAVGKELCYTGETIEGERFFPGWLYDREEPFVQDVLEKLHEMGYEPEITQYNFCTNGSHYAGEKGIRTIGFGPSLESLAHTVDEYVLTEQLSRSADGYAALLEALLVCTGKPQIPAKN